MTRRLLIILASLAALGLLLESSVYTVAENEQVLITEFGKIMGAAINTPGLHWRSPFIQDVHSFDKRWLDSGQARRTRSSTGKSYWYRSATNAASARRSVSRMTVTSL